MKKNSAPAADPKVRVGDLQRRAQDARKRAEAAKKQAQDAKQRAREARRLFKEAKKVAKKARNELAALSDKLKKLIDGEPQARSKGAAAARDNKSGSKRGKKKPASSKGKAAVATVARSQRVPAGKAKKSPRPDEQAKQQAKDRGGKSKAAKRPGAKAASAKSKPAAETAPAEAKPRGIGKLRAVEKPESSSVEAVAPDNRRATESSSRTSEETTAIEPAGQNTPEESAA